MYNKNIILTSRPAGLPAGIGRSLCRHRPVSMPASAGLYAGMGGWPGPHRNNTVLLFHTGITGANRQYQYPIQCNKKSDFPDTPFEDILIFLKMFMKKGYCHIDGKVCTINFCGGSERVCGTFADW